MENIIHTLAIVLPIIALSSVIVVVCVNLYLKIRRKFLIKVNCWFCNQWTKVQYDEQNCFECPTCLQYNGFDANGDYNKPIPAQHDELLNQQVPIPTNDNQYPSSNGLCHLCNNNQQLRIYQLANFIPLNEANFDVEIEHFQKQLDKAYKLCSKCEGVVKKTIRKQNCLLGLKLSQLRKKGLLLLDLNTSCDGISKKAKWLFLENLINFTLCGFAFLNLISVITQLDVSDRSLKQVTPKWMVAYVLLIKNIYLMVAEVIKNVCSNLYQNINYTLLELPLATETLPYLNSVWNILVNTTKTHLLPLVPEKSIESAALLGIVGVLLQFIGLLWSHPGTIKRKLLQLFIWTVLACVHWGYPYHKHLNYVNFLQIALSTAIISSMCFTQNPQNFKPKKTKRVFTKLEKQRRKSTNNTLGDLSDNEELENSCTSPHNSTPKSQSSFQAGTATTNSCLSDTAAHPVPNGKPGVQPLEKHLCKTPFCDNNSTTTAGNSLNQSFTSARSYISDRTSLADTASNFNDSFFKPTSANLENDLDIDISLNKLHLGKSLVAKAPSTNAFYVNTNVARPRPVISPAKLRNITQNSWVAGGFWRNSNGILMPVSNFNNLSRSSSQTSGFVEPNHVSSLPSSVDNSFCGDLECNSVFSEPLYALNGAMTQGRNFSQCCTRFPYQNGARPYNRIYHPLVNHEQLVYIAPNYLQSYNSMYDVYLNKNVSNRNSSPDLQKKYF